VTAIVPTLPGDSVRAVLERRNPHRIVYAPNYWQWFAHQRNHGLLPREAAHCRDQLELIEYLGLDVLSRNIYCDEQLGWWGGLCDVDWDGVEFEEQQHADGFDRVIHRIYRTRDGTLSERLRYIFRESTLVQEQFAVNDYAAQLDSLEALLAGRRWRFISSRLKEAQNRVGDRGIVMAGELFSPLKMLHVLMGPIDTTYFLMDFPERASELLALHEAAQLDLVRQMADAGVRVMVSMDNLDALFHTPTYLERYSASFYEQASRICHEHGCLFLIHACGRQRNILRLIASLGVDGLEGVAFSPLGDVALDEAMRLTGDRFIITGGISALEFGRLRSREEVFMYLRHLLLRMRGYAHRFALSSSCNTPYDAPWETICHFRDAWLEYGEL